MEQDEKYMREALREARLAADAGEIPIGAVVVWKGRIIGRGHNQTERLHDTTAHAEMLAITSATETMGGKYLNDCTLYVTVEPCPMCAGALLMSRLGRCVFGTADPEAGCCGSVYDLPADPLLHGSTVWEHGGPEEECRALLDRFFSERRNEGGKA